MIRNRQVGVFPKFGVSRPCSSSWPESAVAGTCVIECEDSVTISSFTVGVPTSGKLDIPLQLVKDCRREGERKVALRTANSDSVSLTVFGSGLSDDASKSAASCRYTLS